MLRVELVWTHDFRRGELEIATNAEIRFRGPIKI